GGRGGGGGAGGHEEGRATEAGVLVEPRARAGDPPPAPPVVAVPAGSVPHHERRDLIVPAVAAQIGDVACEMRRTAAHVAVLENGHLCPPEETDGRHAVVHSRRHVPQVLAGADAEIASAEVAILEETRAVARQTLAAPPRLRRRGRRAAEADETDGDDESACGHARASAFPVPGAVSRTPDRPPSVRTSTAPWRR